jgi:hypothetical protein
MEDDDGAERPLLDSSGEKRPLLIAPTNMMYADMDDQRLRGKKNKTLEERDDDANGAFIVFFILAGLISCFVVFSNGFTTLPPPGIPVETMKRLQLAKDGLVTYGSLSDEDQVTLFADFQGTFKRAYDTKKEEKSRMKYFKQFLDRVDERNANEKKLGGSAVHGLTIFADLSPEEFKENFMGYIPPKSSSLKFEKLKVSVDLYQGDNVLADWTGVYTTAVNNQLYCGSCWAFSSVQQIESDAIRAGLITPDQPLSVQQLISCDNKFNDALDKSVYNYGCQGASCWPSTTRVCVCVVSAQSTHLLTSFNTPSVSGGNTEQAYEYVAAVGGVAYAADYDYTSGEKGITGTCRTAVNDYAVTVDTYYALARCVPSRVALWEERFVKTLCSYVV